jgi:ribonuclease P protein component
MLPRERRLASGRDWQTLFAQGFGVSVPAMSLRIRHTPGERRVGFSVGKKVGPAVVRNRVKRRLREIARSQWERLPEADIAVLARPATAGMAYRELEAAFTALAERAARREPGKGR